MANISNGALSLTRRDVSILARNLSTETGLSHTRALALIARGLGFADSNALMGSLKQSEERNPSRIGSGTGAPAAAPDAPRSGWRYDLGFSLLIDDDEPLPDTLDEIAMMCDSGPAIGGKLEISGTPLTRDALAALATEFGSTPDFFFGHEDDEAGA